MVILLPDDMEAMKEWIGTRPARKEESELATLSRESEWK